MKKYFKKKKGIVIVNSLIVNSGAERRTLDLMLHLRKNHYHIEVCVLRKIGQMAEIYRKNGFVVHFIKVYRAERNKRSHIYITNFLKLFIFLLKQRYGVILCSQAISYYFGRLASFPPMGRKIIAIERGEISHKHPKQELFLNWLCSKWTYKVVCISTYMRDKTAGINLNKLVVIEDGIPIEPVKNPQKELRQKIGDRFVFGNVGVLLPGKRQEILIKAFSKVLEIYSDCVLILVGGGEDENKLKKMVNQLGLKDEVIFTGHQQNPHDFYPLFDVFVFPSIREGLGNVYIEAWLHFLPVICADLRPMNDYVKHNYSGLLFKPDNVHSLSKQMIRLIQDNSLRKELGQNGHKTAKSKFDFKKQLEKFVALIRDC